MTVILQHWVIVYFLPDIVLKTEADFSINFSKASTKSEATKYTSEVLSSLIKEYDNFSEKATALLAGKVQGVVVHIKAYKFESFNIPNDSGIVRGFIRNLTVGALLM